MPFNSLTCKYIAAQLLNHQRDTWRGQRLYWLKCTVNVRSIYLNTNCSGQDYNFDGHFSNFRNYYHKDISLRYLCLRL